MYDHFAVESSTVGDVDIELHSELREQYGSEAVSRVVQELRADGRLPIAELARRCELSVNKAKALLDDLLAKRIITITPIINPNSIGYSALAFVELERTSDRAISEIRFDLHEIREADYVAWISGPADLAINLIAKDLEDLGEILENRVRTIPGIRIRTVAPYLSFPYQKTGRTGSVTRSENDALHEVDWLESALIRSLSRNGRASNSEIARELGVSESAIRARIKRLAIDGVMRVGAILNTRSSLLEPTALVRVRVVGDTNELVTVLREFEFVTFIAEVIADYDLIVEVTAHDSAELALAFSELRKLPAIASLDSSICFDVQYKSMVPPASREKSSTEQSANGLSESARLSS